MFNVVECGLEGVRSYYVRKPAVVNGAELPSVEVRSLHRDFTLLININYFLLASPRALEYPAQLGYVVGGVSLLINFLLIIVQLNRPNIVPVGSSNEGLIENASRPMCFC